ncbi:glutathione transferase [Aureococcus anophagefferens]|nr:glutathione transferase [Aureococcus anophagefferens]
MRAALCAVLDRVDYGVRERRARDERRHAEDAARANPVACFLSRTETTSRSRCWPCSSSRRRRWPGGGPKRPRGLALRAGSAAVEERAPALTLYRDTNGWCPFCERVWVALEKKGIPYDEVLINLQDKPDWYKEIVPTTLVPAIEFHDDAWDASARGSGRLVWESADILAALDAEFGGPALAGAEAPLMKRVLETSVGFLRVLKPDFPPLDAGRPGLEAWFAAMDAEPAYGRRVKGDAYSWTAVTSSFLRIFRKDDPATAAKVAAADAAARHARRSVAGDRWRPRRPPSPRRAPSSRRTARPSRATPRTRAEDAAGRTARRGRCVRGRAIDAARRRGAAPRALRRVRGAARSTTTPASPRRPSRRACAPRDVRARGPRCARGFKR